MVRIVIFRNRLLSKAFDNLLGNHRFPLTDGVSILDNFQIAVNHENSSVIQIRKLFQLAVNDLRIRIVQIAVCNEVIGQNLALVLDFRGSHGHGARFIIIQYGHTQNNARYDACQTNNQKNAKPQASH